MIIIILIVIEENSTPPKPPVKFICDHLGINFKGKQSILHVGSTETGQFCINRGDLLRKQDRILNSN